MVFFKNDIQKIRCFEYTKNQKIIKSTLLNLMNREDKSYALIETPMFGISHVYTFIDFSACQYLNNINNHQLLSLTRVVGESPIIEDVNTKSKEILISELSLIDKIFLYQLKMLTQGMNIISDFEGNDTMHYLTIGNNIDEDISNYLLNFNYDKENFKYIILFKNGEYEYSNSIHVDKFEGIFIKIPEFNCWQYLSYKKYKVITRAKMVNIKYGIVDSPRCFSKVGYHQEYFADTFENILKYSIYIPLDIYFNKLFYSPVSCQSNEYHALDITIHGRYYDTSILLTYDELGIDINQNLSNYNNVLYMDKFCLLKLINNLICLKP